MHLSKCGHPIIGDPTYCDDIESLKSIKLNRMYLDSHQIILNFKKENKTIQVSTNSKYTFSALIIDEILERSASVSIIKSDQLLFPNHIHLIHITVQ